MQDLNPEWKIVDGKWRHLVTRKEGDNLVFYTDGAKERRKSNIPVFLEE